MKLDYCFHTHTTRCGHAEGTEVEYIENAIGAGVKVLGFSDHIFLPGIPQKGIRGNYEQLEDYKTTIRSLEKQYKDKIEIHLGFECEYFDQFHDYYYELMEKEGFDYLILGQHFFLDENNKFTYIRNGEIEESFQRYLDQSEKAMKTGLFLYFAHPDLALTIYPSTTDEGFINASHRICKLAKKYNMPIEININGMTWFQEGFMSYPIEAFWKIVGEEGNDVTIGFDAHYPNIFNETEFSDRALSWVKKYNLKLLAKEQMVERLNKIKRH